MHDDRRSAATIGKKFCLPPNVSVLESILFKDVTMIEHIRQRIAHAPRIPLGVWPTPFMAMDHLRETIGSSCPRLWVKREDLTPLGAGGNKVRKLEFVLARAMAEGADVLLNTGEVQSNQVVQTAAAAAHLGIPCELFLGCMDPPLSEDEKDTGNILLCRILGARIHLLPPGEDRAAAMRTRAEELKKEGRHPYIIPRGSSTQEGSLGSLSCFFELLEQAAEHDFVPDAIVVTVGSSGTTAGFLVGAQAMRRTMTRKIGIWAFDVFGSEYPVSAHDRIMSHAEESWRSLELPGNCGEDSLHLSGEFVGPGYCRPYQGMLDAVRLVAGAEGFVADPNYTGKCLAGLLHLLRSGVFRPDQNIVYLHSGGLPALFAMHRYFN